ncbi:MAG: serine hydrolase domain-containing protein [Trueperaceae bacterium]
MRRVAAFVLLLLGSLAVGQSAPAAPSAADLAAIDAFVADRMRAHAIPGVALAITHGGAVVHARGLGDAGDGQPMTADTPLYIGSIAKAFTGLAVLQLVDDGLLDLDAPVRAYLPWFEVADPDVSARITVRHLLGHASGLSDLRYRDQPGLADDATIEAGVRDLQRAVPIAEPGEAFHYFNPNYATLGHLVEVASGEPYAEYLRAHVLDPLGMERTFTDPNAARAAGLARGHVLAFGVAWPRAQRFRDYSLPAGYVMSTANDMARFLLAMNGGGALDGARVLSPAGMRALHAPSAPSGFYAAGWFVGTHRGHRIVQHGGTNEFFKAEAAVFPDLDLGVVLLANQASLPSAIFAYGDLTGGVRDLLVGEQPTSPPIGMRTVGLLLAVAFAVQLALIARDARRLPRWLVRARGWRAPRLALAVAPHLLLVPVIALVAMALIERFLGRGVSLAQAFDGVPEVAIMMAVGYAADLVFAAWKVAAWTRGRAPARRAAAAVA